MVLQELERINQDMTAQTEYPGIPGKNNNNGVLSIRPSGR